MVKLKIAELAEAQTLAQLGRKTFLEAYEGVHSDADLSAYCDEHYCVAVFRELLTQDKAEVIIAWSGNTAVGFVVIKHHSCPCELPGAATEIKQIYVSKEYYGTGLGNTLFNHALLSSLKNNSRWLWLCVSDKNHRAQRFYQKLHFARIGIGPELKVGQDHLPSSILALNLTNLESLRIPS